MKFQALITFVLISAITAGPVLENVENASNADEASNEIASNDYSSEPSYGGETKPILPEIPDIKDKLEGIKDGVKDKIDGVKDKIIEKVELIKHLFDCLLKVKFEKLIKLIDLKKKFLKKLICKDYFEKPGYCKESELPKPYRVIKAKGTDSTTFSKADLDFNDNRVNFITNEKDEVVDIMLG